MILKNKKNTFGRKWVKFDAQSKCLLIDCVEEQLAVAVAEKRSILDNFLIVERKQVVAVFQMIWRQRLSHKMIADNFWQSHRVLANTLS